VVPVLHRTAVLVVGLERWTATRRCGDRHIQVCCHGGPHPGANQISGTDACRGSRCRHRRGGGLVHGVARRPAH